MRKKEKILYIIILLIVSLVALSIKYNKPSLIIGSMVVPLLFINLYPLLFYKLPVTKSKQQKFDAIIVLGYPAAEDGSPSPIMRERVVKAVELLNKGYAKHIICCGGSAHNTYIEAEVMINLARTLGVPDNNLIEEGKSVNTYGNILNSVELMKEKKWSSAVVVTSPWHVRRSSYLLSKFNITYVMKKSECPKEFSIFYIAAIYMFENYIMLKNKVLFH